jgi:urea transport system ATP-binding protein
MSNTDFILAIEDLTVSFDGFKAVDSLSMYIDKNELRVVIGPNGAGKTTVLDLICGKTKSTEGSIKFKNIESLRQTSVHGFQNPQNFIEKINKKN